MDRAAILTEPQFFPLDVAMRRGEALSSFATALRQSGYTERSLRAKLRTARLTGVDPVWRDIWGRYMVGGSDADDVFIRTFFLSYPVAERTLVELLGRDEVASLLDVRLLDRVEGGDVRAPVCLYPVDDTYVATDWWLESDAGAEAAPHRVMPLVVDSYGLARLVASWRGGRALDLCTGSGVAALKAARNAEQVVGVDVNPRAINFARFNALLNGLGNCRFVEGDTYEPVNDSSFDLICANPPFVPTPGRPRVLYRDGGAQGEDILRRIVEGCGRHLDDEGVCVIRAHQVRREDSAYETKVRSWLGSDDGFTVVIFRGSPIHPFEYALGHLRGDRSTDRVFRWIDHYREQGIDEVCQGYLALRKRSTGGTVAVELPIREVFEEDVPEGYLEGLFARVEQLDPDGIQGLRFRKAYTPSTVELVPDGPDLGDYRLAYEIAAALEEVPASQDPGSVEELMSVLRARGLPLGPERQAELEEIVTRLFVAGYLRSVDDPSGDDAASDARRLATQLWWSR